MDVSKIGPEFYKQREGLHQSADLIIYFKKSLNFCFVSC